MRDCGPGGSLKCLTITQVSHIHLATIAGKCIDDATGVASMNCFQSNLLLNITLPSIVFPQSRKLSETVYTYAKDFMTVQTLPSYVLLMATQDHTGSGYPSVEPPGMVEHMLPLTPGTDFLLTHKPCLLYTSPSPRDVEESRMPSSA